MAHFAKVNEENIVVDIIRVSDADCNNLPFPDSEAVGKQFIASLGVEGKWVQTSYNSSFRKQYPFQGSYYDEANDVFVFPQPYPSWSLDNNFDWQPPVPMPNENCYWDEKSLSWKEFEVEA
jgi:hypothetical protein